MVALVCFFPIVTGMIAHATQRNVSRLEARIAELERQSTQKRV